MVHGHHGTDQLSHLATPWWPERKTAAGGSVIAAPCRSTPWLVLRPLVPPVAVVSRSKRTSCTLRRDVCHRWIWPRGAPLFRGTAWRPRGSLENKRGAPVVSVLRSARCPQMRATRWWKNTRELSLLTRVRHCQALAERWRQAIFQPAIVPRRFLTRACATAERLTAKALRKRRTTAQILREQLRTQHAPTACAEAVHA